MKKTEQREIAYCDICGKESSGHCWKCGIDVCDQHHHLVHVDHLRHTYPCTPCRDKMVAELEDLFDKYSAKKPL